MADQPNDLIDQLRARQGAALHIVSTVLDDLSAGKDAYVSRLQDRRGEMRAALTSYQTFKHEEVFDPILAHGAPDQRALALDAKTHCIAEGERYRAYVQEWPLDRVAREWDAYRVVVRLIGGRLHRHLREEGDTVCGLIARNHR